MGSVLSFLVLCIANLGLQMHVTKECFDEVYALNKEHNSNRPRLFKKIEREILIERLRAVRVNGDDMFYRGSKEIYRRHVVAGAQVGLNMSPGKSYVHKRYANANSTSLDFINENEIVEIPYFNTGLFFNQHKVMGKVDTTKDDSGKCSTEKQQEIKEEEDEIQTVACNVKKILAGCPDDKTRCNILRAYFVENKEVLNKDLRGRNLFLPIALGGFGVNPPRGFHVRLTDTQERYARFCIHSHRLRTLKDSVDKLIGEGPIEFSDRSFMSRDELTEIADLPWEPTVAKKKFEAFDRP